MSIATELTALSGHITNAYDAVQTKGGTIPANKNMANLDDAILSIQSGADITNGTKIQAKSSSGTIPASTFFEINNTGMERSSEQNVSDYRYSGQNPKTVQLTENTFFSIRRSSTAKTIGACVSQYNNGVLTVGAERVVATNTFSTAYTPTTDSAIAKISDNKVLVVYYDVSRADSSKFSLYGVICSISGTAITVGAPTVVVEAPYQSLGSVNSYAITLNQNTAILKYALNANNTTAVVLTVSGTTIAVGTPATIDSYAPRYNTIFKVSDTVLGMFGYSGKRVRAWDVASGTISNQREVVFTSRFEFGGMSGSDNRYVCVSPIPGTNYYVGVTAKAYAVVEFGATGITIVDQNILDAEAYSLMSHALVEMGDGSFVYACIRSSTSSATITGTRLCGYRLIWDGARVTITSYGDLDPNPSFSDSYSSDLMTGVRTSTGSAFFLYTSNNLSSGALNGVAINPRTGDVYLQGQISENAYSANSTNVIFNLSPTTLILFFSYTANSSSYLKAMLLDEMVVINESATRIDGVTVDDISSSSSGEAWIFEDEIFYGDADTRRF